MIDDALVAHFKTLMSVAGAEMRYSRLDESFAARMVLARRRQDVEEMQKSASLSAKIVDLLIRPSDFKLGEPQRGDKIHMPNGRNFEVRSQPNLPCWEWSDPRHTFMRIHTVEQESLVPTVPTVTGFVIGDGTAQRSLVDSITVEFDGDVTVSPAAFELKHRSSGLLVSTSHRVSGNVVVVSFSGTGTRSHGVLEDGYYQLTIAGSEVTRDGVPMASDVVIGGVESDGFFALFADIDGDGILGIIDFGQFRSAFGKNSNTPGYNFLFDFDDDGVIGIVDFGQFRARFGKQKLQF